MCEADYRGNRASPMGSAMVSAETVKIDYVKTDLRVRWRQPPLWYQSGGYAAALLDHKASLSTAAAVGIDPAPRPLSTTAPTALPRITTAFCSSTTRANGCSTGTSRGSTVSATPPATRDASAT